MSNLFNLLSLFYAFRGLQIAAAVARQWKQLTGLAFPPQYRSLAEQASFFLAVPISVLFHEGAHALAVWAFGGRVLEFGYRVFWGFVRPAGRFTLAEYWFIALAGTLGSLLFGLFLWLLLRGNRAPTLRYFALRALRYQIHFSLIYYPLFSFVGVVGDWLTIYDFKATPLLSGLTAGAHVLTLGAYLVAERRGAFQMASFVHEEDRSALADIEARADEQPEDVRLQLELIDEFRRGGQSNKAISRLRDFLERHPQSAEGHLLMAFLQAEGRARIPARARDSAARALALGLSSPAATAQANRVLGQYYLGLGKADEALRHFDQAVAASESSGNAMEIAHASYLRALAQRRKGHYQAAYQDIRKAIDLAEAQGAEPVLALFRQEMETIEHHSGRKRANP